MSTSSARIAATKEPSRAEDLARGAAWFLWQAVRLPVFSFLMVLEPVVRFVLSTIALLGVLVAFVLEFSGAAPRFPFWGMVSGSVGCVLLLMLYYLLLRLFSR